MQFLKVSILVLLLLPIFVIASDSVPEDCEMQSPLNQNPLEEIAPNCFTGRKLLVPAQELLEKDLQICNCIDQNPMLKLLRPATGQSSSSENVSESEMQEPEDDSESDATEMITSADVIPPERVNQQCVTYVEFVSSKAVPTDNNFFSSIPTGAFSPRDWDMEELSKTYDRVSAEEKVSISARMKFLASNPAIATLMSSGPTVTPLHRQKQQTLFDILKTLAPPTGSTCHTRPNGCWEEVFASGKYEQYGSQMVSLFQDDQLNAIIAERAEKIPLEVTDYYSRVAREGREVITTPEELLRSAEANLPPIALGCSERSANADCYELFPAHCVKARALRDRMARNLPPLGHGLRSQIEVQQYDSTSLEEFEKYNDMVCNSPHRNASGQTMTFFQFRAQNCPPGGQGIPSCSNRTLLLSQYLSAYPGSGDDVLNRSVLSKLLSKSEIIAANERLFLAAENVRSLLQGPSAKNKSRPVLSTEKRLALTGSSLKPGPGSEKKPSPSTQTPSSLIGSSSSGAVDSASTFPDSGNSQAFRSRESDFLNTPGQSSSYNPQDFRSNALVNTEESPPTTKRKRRVKRKNDPFSYLRESPLSSEIPAQTPALVSPLQSAPAAVQRSPASAPETRNVQSRRSGAEPASAEAVTGGARSTAGGKRAPVVEVTPRRSSRSTSVMENSSKNSPANFDYRPVIPIELNEGILRNVLSNPQILASDASVMQKVNDSPEEVVRLGLRTPGSSEDTVIYAVKENGQVRFSLSPPTETATRTPILENNEMNVRLLDTAEFSEVRQNPDKLKSYSDLLRVARTLPGNVVRMNIIPSNGQKLTVYLDKRTSQIRTTP